MILLFVTFKDYFQSEQEQKIIQETSIRKFPILISYLIQIKYTLFMPYKFFKS